MCVFLRTDMPFNIPIYTCPFRVETREVPDGNLEADRLRMKKGFGGIQEVCFQ